MPDSREFDVRYLPSLELPYDIVTKELSDGTPRLVAGNDTYITQGGKIAQAPGLSDSGLTAFTVSKRPDRLVSYETLENPPKIYLLASLYNSGTGKWECYYLRVNAAVPAWTSMGSYRDLDQSTRPHEIVCARGLAFIKGYPGSSGDKYGSVVFNGATATVHAYPWGIPGAALTQSPNLWDAAVYPWAASVMGVTVSYGWRYAIAYESPTGQLSNRNYLEIYPTGGPVPGSVAGDTGAFTNLKPRFLMYTFLYPAAQFPYINIFRTTDGGGTFYFLDRVANAGGVLQTYTDDQRDAGSNTDNPKTDFQLDTFNICPSTTSNTVPPPCSPSGVIGTAPVEPSTAPAYYARRVWYAIGNRLYYSGREEILNGVPEESFPNPNGLVGNFYTVQGQVRFNVASKKALYVGTSNEIMYVTGQDRTNFFLDTIVSDIGAAQGHPKAAIAFRDSLFFLGSDLQVYGISGNSAPQIISTPLGSSIRDRLLLQAEYEVQFEIFSRDGFAWLIVNIANRGGANPSIQYVYDLQRNLWFTPWGKTISAMCFGRLSESDPRKHFIAINWNGSTGKLAVLDTDTATDAGTGYTPAFTTNLFTVPAGNHINELRKHGHFPVISYLLTERTKFTSDHDPAVTYRLDEFSGSTTAAVSTDPPFGSQRASHTDAWYPIQQACQRVQLALTGTSGERLEVQNVGFVFMSEAGA